MGSRPIKAVTFDLWDTVIVDDSDEPKRAANGLPPKPVMRRQLVHEFLARREPIARESVDAAYDAVDAAFHHVWYEQCITWTVAERLAVLLKGLKRELPDDETAELVRLHENMELEVRPDMAPGAVEAIQALKGRYRLGVISDAIFSPGRALRELLAGAGLLDAFDVFVFSDEAGASKPEPRLFETAAQGLGVEPSELVHIGDREQKDIAGPAAVGARSILATVVRDRGSENTRADAVCKDYSRLAATLENL